MLILLSFSIIINLFLYADNAISIKDVSSPGVVTFRIQIGECCIFFIVREDLVLNQVRRVNAAQIRLHSFRPRNIGVLGIVSFITAVPSRIRLFIAIVKEGRRREEDYGTSDQAMTRNKNI